jgi:hypothetical protein
MSGTLWYLLHTHTHHTFSLNSVQSPRRKEKFIQKDSGERIKPFTLEKNNIVVYKHIKTWNVGL